MEYNKDKIEICEKKRKGSKNLTYEIIYDTWNKIIFNMDNILIPFGIENYGVKKIINLEISKKNNDHYNFLQCIKKIEEIIINICKDNDEFKEKNFYSSLKKRGNSLIHIRTHLLCSGKNIKTKFMKMGKEDNTILLNKKDNLDKYKCKIILDSIWIHNNEYGLVWMLEEINNIN
jgi:hypothetical protein